VLKIDISAMQKKFQAFPKIANRGIVPVPGLCVARAKSTQISVNNTDIHCNLQELVDV
jgi:hypothetical protein